MKNYRTLISLSFALTCGLAACADTEDSLSDLQDSLHKKGRSVDGGVRGDVSDDSDESADEAQRDEGDGGRVKRDGGRGRGRFDRGCSRKRGDGGFSRGDRDRDEASEEDGTRGHGRGTPPDDSDEQDEEDVRADDDRQSDDDQQDDEDTRGPRGDRGTGPVGVDGGIPRTR